MATELRKGAKGFPFVRPISKGLGMLLFVPYHLLSRSGMFYFLKPPSSRVSVLTFDMHDGPQHHIFIGKRTVGKFDFKKGKWNIQPPFKLFFDERKYTVDSIPN